MVISLTNVALSHVVPDVTPLCVGDGLSVASIVELGEGLGVEVGEGDGDIVSVVVGSTVAIPANTV
jgi:hypothetical protein